MPCTQAGKQIEVGGLGGEAGGMHGMQLHHGLPASTSTALAHNPTPPLAWRRRTQPSWLSST